MTDKPSEAAIREACRRAGCSEDYTSRAVSSQDGYNTAMLAASLIEKYEPDTLIDPVTKRAREIFKQENPFLSPDNISKGMYDNGGAIRAIIRALKEGMPK